MPTVSTLTQQNDSSFKFPIPKKKTTHAKEFQSAASSKD